MNAVLVAKIAKNKLEEIRVSVLRNNKIDVRTYFFFPNEPEPKPTKKGIWLSFKHIPQIISAFDGYVKDPKKEFSLEFDIPEKESEKIRVYVNDYMGGKVIHIRTFYLKENEMVPGRGVSFSPAVLPQVLEAFKNLPKDQ